MGRIKFPTIFTSNRTTRIPLVNPIQQNFLKRPEKQDNGFLGFFFGFFRRLKSPSTYICHSFHFFFLFRNSWFGFWNCFLRWVCVVFLKFVDKIDGGSRTEAEEKLYSWLYALAQSEKDLVFEYVQSTERGEYFFYSYLKLNLNKTLEGLVLAW